MIALSDDHLAGASFKQQDLFDTLMAHEREEEEVIEAYEAFAGDTRSDAVRYLIRLIVDDEKRHHRVLSELANAVRDDATFEKHEARVPYLDVRKGDDSVLKLTESFLAIENRERKEFKRLARKTRTVGGELDAFIVSLLEADTERHIRILRFIKRAMRESAIR